MEIEKLFNPKRTIFLGMDEQGRIQARGRFFGELTQEEYPSIRSCVLSGFKRKNLIELVELFPNLIEVYIEKNSNLTSLQGIEKLTDLRQITIGECPKLIDLSSLKQCATLAEIRLESFKTVTNVLSFLNPQIVNAMSLNSNITDLDLIIKFENIDYLTLRGFDSDLEYLPSLPKVRKSFNLDGFSKLKDASFMSNLDADMRITWWGPKPINGIPDHLKTLETFK